MGTKGAPIVVECIDATGGFKGPRARPEAGVTTTDYLSQSWSSQWFCFVRFVDSLLPSQNFFSDEHFLFGAHITS